MITQNLSGMDKEQQSFFDENGYLGPIPMGDIPHLSDLKHSLEQSSKVSGTKVENLLVERDAHIKFRLVYDIATLPCIKDSISELLGDNLLLWIGHVICRPPGDKGQSWHVDQTNKNVAGVHVSVAVTDMNLSNGCMHVIPKTHKYAEISNSYFGEQQRLGNIDLRDGDSMLRFADHLHPENAPHQIVPIQLNSGQYCLTKGGLWHGVTPHKSDQTRIVLIARYMSPQKKITSHEGRNPLNCIIVKGKDTYSKNVLSFPPLPLFKKYLFLNYSLNMYYNKILKKFLDISALVNE